MSRKVYTFTPELTAPRWMGDYADRNSLLPGSSLVNADKWPVDTGGRKNIPGGTLLGRRLGAHLWEPVANDKNTNLGTALTADAPVGSTKLSVATTSGYRIGDVLTITNGTNTINNATVDEIDHENGMITLQAATATHSFVAGDTVRLTTAVAQTEFYLLAYDVVDAVKNAEAPALYKHNSVVRFNFLPGYPFTGLPNVEAQIRSLYQCISAI